MVNRVTPMYHMEDQMGQAQGRSQITAGIGIKG